MLECFDKDKKHEHGADEIFRVDDLSQSKRVYEIVFIIIAHVCRLIHMHRVIHENKNERNPLYHVDIIERFEHTFRHDHLLLRSNSGHNFFSKKISARTCDGYYPSLLECAKKDNDNNEKQVQSS